MNPVPDAVVAPVIVQVNEDDALQPSVIIGLGIAIDKSQFPVVFVVMISEGQFRVGLV